MVLHKIMRIYIGDLIQYMVSAYLTVFTGGKELIIHICTTIPPHVKRMVILRGIMKSSIQVECIHVCTVCRSRRTGRWIAHNVLSRWRVSAILARAHVAAMDSLSITWLLPIQISGCWLWHRPWNMGDKHRDFPVHAHNWYEPSVVMLTYSVQ